MANIHDPETWGKFDEKTKAVLARIKELYFNDTEEIIENPENGGDY